VREIFQPLLFLLARSTDEELRNQVEFLNAENEMLRRRVPKKRIFLKPDERARLLKLGQALGPAVRFVITIVDYSTFRRWVCKADGNEPAKRTGRPRIKVIIREFVVRVAKETGWGYSRILGELKKLRVGKISRQTVKNILLENGLEPGPKRGRGTWSDFLKVHSETLWQCDFFSKWIWTISGPKQAFSLAFINVATRRVFVTPATFSNNKKWMVQQANAFLEHIRQQGMSCTILTRDYDGAFSTPFDKVFTDLDIQVKPVGPRAPNLNAYIERWVQSIKQEALDHFIVFGEEHFNYIVSQYVDYYHECRPHQGIGNVLLPKPRGEPEEEPDVVSIDLATVKCESRLGGLLKHYYHDAA